MSKKIWISIGLLSILALLFGLSTLDQSLSLWVYSLRNSLITPLMRAISWLGSVYFLLPINILILILLYRRHRKLAFTIPLGTLAAWATSDLLKRIILRPRPDIAPIAVETSASFPSGHAMSNTAFYLLLLLWAPKNQWTQALAIAMIVLMNFSRIYLGVHWPSDVLAGSALAIFMVGLIRQWYQASKTKPSTPGVKF